MLENTEGTIKKHGQLATLGGTQYTGRRKKTKNNITMRKQTQM